MRTFVQAVYFNFFGISLLLNLALPVHANPSFVDPALNQEGLKSTQLNLFSVTLVPTEEQMLLPTSERVTHLVKSAMEAELVRLNGSKRILSTPEAKQFLDNPKIWLKRYRSEPRAVDGVVIGEQWVFEFSEQRLYQAFQKNGLIVWPAEKRPKTLVFGTQVLGNVETRITQSRLQEQPLLDIADTVANFGLEIQVPKESGMWVTPVEISYSDEAASRAEIAGMDYVFAYQFIYDAEGKEFFIWQLFNRNGQVILLGDEMTDSPERAFNQQQIQQAFEQVTDYYSRGYHAQASVLGVATLLVENIFNLDDLTKIESELQKSKPKIHSSYLSQFSQAKALFSLTYQGDFDGLVEMLSAFNKVTLVEKDPLTRSIAISIQGTSVTGKQGTDTNKEATPQPKVAPMTGLIDLTHTKK